MHAREEFRHTSVISAVATATITGLGVEGYRAALRFLAGVVAADTVVVMAMTLRLTDEEADVLRRAAEAEGVSMQAFARAAVLARASGWAADRDAFLLKFAADNQSLLDRLAQ